MTQNFEGGANQRLIGSTSKGNDAEVEQKVLAGFKKLSQMEKMECGIRWAVKAKRKAKVMEGGTEHDQKCVRHST